MKKWILNLDLLTLIIGVALVYYAEDIITVLYPLDPIPAATIAILYYFLFFAIATFWIFNGIAYTTIKIFWGAIHEYFEDSFTTDFKALSTWQKICISMGFYSLLFSLLVIVFMAVMQVMKA